MIATSQPPSRRYSAVLDFKISFFADFAQLILQIQLLECRKRQDQDPAEAKASQINALPCPWIQEADFTDDLSWTQNLIGLCFPIIVNILDEALHNDKKFIPSLSSRYQVISRSEYAHLGLFCQA